MCVYQDSLQFKLPEQGEDMHPQYRAKPKPDFEGDVNPETGEVGGPKKDPLRWESEYTFNGRTTDCEWPNDPFHSFIFDMKHSLI